MTEAQPTSVASLTTTSSKAEKENAQIKQTTLQLCIKDTPSLKRKSRTLTVKPGGKDFRRIGYSEFNTYALLQRSSTWSLLPFPLKELYVLRFPVHCEHRSSRYFKGCRGDEEAYY